MDEISGGDLENKIAPRPKSRSRSDNTTPRDENYTLIDV
jgi:hypothetical protein